VEKTLGEMSRTFREAVNVRLSRRGAVVAVSGGIDSSVCAVLAVEAFGKDKVYGLILPERDSSPASRILGEELCRRLDIAYEVKDIAPILEAIGCYSWRDDAIRMVFPEYGPGWKNKILISQGLLDSDRMNFFKLAVEKPDGEAMEKRLPLKAYLQIVAATNFKQRIRKTLEYFHADRLNFAVTGTPNRLEYDQGFFVKNGDGSADVKPIAHLYKTQVYELGRHFRLPDSILSTRPSTDTYSLSQTQEEFYFVLPYEKMDLVLFGFNAGKSPEEVGRETGLTPGQILRVFRDIQVKRRTTAPLHMKPILLAPVPEVAS
jgi:NAD+ synthase